MKVLITGSLCQCVMSVEYILSQTQLLPLPSVNSPSAHRVAVTGADRQQRVGTGRVARALWTAAEGDCGGGGGAAQGGIALLPLIFQMALLKNTVSSINVTLRTKQTEFLEKLSLNHVPVAHHI